MARIVFLLLMLSVYMADTRYIHPMNAVKRMEQTERESAALTEIDGLPVEVLRNLTPNRFVPFNNVLFFKSYEPCEEGLERDLLGVCREVWD